MVSFDTLLAWAGFGNSSVPTPRSVPASPPPVAVSAPPPLPQLSSGFGLVEAAQPSPPPPLTAPAIHIPTAQETYAFTEAHPGFVDMGTTWIISASRPGHSSAPAQQTPSTAPLTPTEEAALDNLNVDLDPPEQAAVGGTSIATAPPVQPEHANPSFEVPAQAPFTAVEEAMLNNFNIDLDAPVPPPAVDPAAATTLATAATPEYTPQSI